MNITSMLILRLGGNRISGTLPASWTAFRGLQELDLSNNLVLCDAVPSNTFGNADAPAQLSGSMVGAGCAPQFMWLMRLRLNNNLLSGTICQPTGAITQLDVSYNRLSGKRRAAAAYALSGRGRRAASALEQAPWTPRSSRTRWRR